MCTIMGYFNLCLFLDSVNQGNQKRIPSWFGRNLFKIGPALVLDGFKISITQQLLFNFRGSVLNLDKPKV